MLTRRGLTHDQPRVPRHRFLTTGSPETFEGIGHRLDGRPGRPTSSSSPDGYARRGTRPSSAAAARSPGRSRPPPAIWSRPRTRAGPSPWWSISGPGAFGPSTAISTRPTVDAYALSHLHPDHCLDLCALLRRRPLLADRPWPPADRSTARPAPASRMARAYDVPVRDGAVSETGPGHRRHLRLPRLAARAADRSVHRRPPRVDHPVEAYALRDRGERPGRRHAGLLRRHRPARALVELARDADLLLVESAFMDRPGQPARAAPDRPRRPPRRASRPVSARSC